MITRGGIVEEDIEGGITLGLGCNDMVGTRIVVASRIIVIIIKMAVFFLITEKYVRKSLVNCCSVSNTYLVYRNQLLGR